MQNNPDTKHRPSRLAVIALAGFLLPLVQPRADAAGENWIEWGPSEVLEFVQPGQTKDVRVSFRSSKALGATLVRVGQQLSPYITPIPSRFDRILVNQDYAVTLRVKAGAKTEFKVDGALELRASSTAALRRALPVHVVVHKDPVPSDPGQLGIETTAGIDSDSDGVRDDIQRYIVAAYVSDTSDERLMLLQYARTLGHILQSANDTTTAESAWLEVFAALRCMSDIVGASEADQRRVVLRARFLNTRERSRIYLKASQWPPPQNTVVDLATPRSSCAF
jgi:hypothetical protein